MTWVKIDEDFAQHPKVLAAGPVAAAMQVAALCWCNKHLTDGIVPRSVVPTLLNLEGLAYEGEPLTWQDVVEDLIAAGMWTTEQNGARYRIHDYLEYQPSREKVEADQAQRVAAGRAGGLAKSKRAAKRTAKRNAAEPPSDSPSETVASPLAKPLAKTYPGPGSGSEPHKATTPPEGGVAHDPLDTSPINVQDLVAAYVDLGGAPTRAGQLGRALKLILARKPPPDPALLRAAVEAIARERKSPGTIDLILAELEAGTRRAEPKGFKGIRDYAQRRGMTP